MRAFHKKAMIKEHIYNNILAKRSEMGYSPGIQFQTSLFNMYKSKALTKNNQTGKSTDKKTVPVWLLIAPTYHLKGMPYRDFLPNVKKALGMGLSQQDTKKAEEDSSAEAEII